MADKGQDLQKSSGSLAMFAAILLASSFVSSLAGDEGQTPVPGIKHRMRVIVFISPDAKSA